MAAAAAALCRRAYTTSMPPSAHVDVAIVGGGMVGSALAAALNANPLTRQLRILLLDRQPPLALPRQVPEWDDLCVSTLTAPTVDILRELGVWRSLSVAAAPFCDMQVWGADDGYVRFDATAVGQAVMGHVLEDSLLKAALHDQLRARGSTVQLMMPATAVAADLPPYSPAAQLEGGSFVRLQLDDGSSLTTRLLVGADGCSSQVRQWSQFRCSGSEREQASLVATVATSWPNQTALQRFLPTGPLALLPARGGFSSVVWSCPSQMAAQLQALPRHELAAAITSALTSGTHYPPKPRLGELLGGILASARSTRFVAPPTVTAVVGHGPRTFLQTAQHAGRYVRPRVALVGDAAHSGHPFGLASQGVNLGFGDAKVLAAAIADAVATGQDIGSAAMLERQYERPRRQPCSAMLSAADALRAIYMPQEGPVAGLRSLGLDIVNNTPLLKQALLRIAMHGL
ncbi:hypothetical protein D9Q98_005392 [Chlorella vulgaris]|uniref:FAD-binding domain-containing protein n=1 Tax=Chlorella vulgaris TaxID=3077 RepID=A0A9D4TLQ3_CHLVU|nr:hypothetical protein D9Q98_005392 [Chlorella vulgaris]